MSFNLAGDSQVPQEVPSQSPPPSTPPHTPPHLRRQNAGKGPMLQRALKRSRDPRHEEESDSDSEPLQPLPDLGEIFDDLGTPLADRISLCRSYASYLAALTKRPKRK